MPAETHETLGFFRLLPDTVDSSPGSSSGSGRVSVDGSVTVPLNHQTHQDAQEDVYTVQEALDRLGFGAWHYMLFCYAGLFWACDAMEILLLSYLGPAATCEWGLSSMQESSLTSAVFGGMLVGAVMWGAVADVMGRTRAGMAMAALTTAFGLLSAVAPSYPVLMAARAGVGFGLAGTSTQYALFMEWLPVQGRGYWLVMFNIWWTVGTAAEVLLAKAVLQPMGWRWLVALSALPFGTLLLLIPFVPDSPKLLAAQGDLTKARRLLASAAAFNRRALPIGKLITDTTEVDDCRCTLPPEPQALEQGTDGAGGQGHLRQSAFRLLLDDLLHLASSRLTSAVLGGLVLVWWVAAFTYYGIIMLTAELSTLDQHPSDATNVSSQASLCTGPSGALQLPPAAYWDVLLSTSAELPSLGFCLAVVGATTYSRYPATAWCFLATALAVSLLLAAPQGALLRLCLFSCRFFAVSAFAILYILTPELLPTRVRACVMGLLNSMSRLGGLVAPFVAVAMVQQGMTSASALVFMAAAGCAAMIIAVVGVKTRGQELSLQRGSLKPEL